MTTRLRVRPAIFCLATALALACAAGKETKADLITTNPDLPPTEANAAYIAQNPAVYSQYNVVLPFPFYHYQFINVVVTPSPGPSGPNELASFVSTLSGIANMGGALIPYTLTGPVDVTTLGNFGLVTGTFTEQMTSMDLKGQVAGHSVEITLDPTLGNSTGQTTITDISGGAGTLFNISSFFDVFTELSVDGGAFDPASGSVHMSLGSVPEPSTWILCIGAALAAPVYVRWHRRRGA